MQMAADCQTGAKSGATGAPLLLILFALLFFWLFFCCFSGQPASLQLDILARILCFQKQKLCHDNAGAYIIYLFSKKDNTVFQKTGVNVIASFSSACLFNDIWY
jgi:hypothetical protein